MAVVHVPTVTRRSSSEGGYRRSVIGAEAARAQAHQVLTRRIDPRDEDIGNAGARAKASVRRRSPRLGRTCR